MQLEEDDDEETTPAMEPDLPEALRARNAGRPLVAPVTDRNEADDSADTGSNSSQPARPGLYRPRGAGRAADRGRRFRLD